MKIVLWLLGLLVFFAISVYVIAFTPIGNIAIAPMIEGKIKENTQLDSKLRTFDLGISDFEFVLDLNENNTILAKGRYSILSQSFEVSYDVKLQELETLKPLSKKDLKGSLHTDGTITGSIRSMYIDGKSDLASSTTKYNVTLIDLEATSIIAKITNADLMTLLTMGGEKPYAKAKVDVDVNFKSIKPHELDGNILLLTRKGILNHKLMSEDFKLSIPKTKFSMNLKAKLKGEEIDYTYSLHSNLAKIKSSGKVIPEPLNLDISYDLDVKELAVLKPIIKEDLRGPFGLNGTAKGTKASMRVVGQSNLAASSTQFSAILKDNKPISLNASIEHLKIQKLLYMLKQPPYGSGVLSLHVDMDDLQKGSLKGNVIANIKKGLLNSKYISKENKFKSRMPKTTFNLVTNTTLNGDMTQTKLNLKSSLLALDIEKANYNIKDKSIDSDFKTTIHNLDKLFFITERHLKGSIRLNGKIKKAKDLDLVVHSKIAGGTLDAKLFNDDLRVDLKSIKTLNALDILMYPKVFKSSLNGKLAYDLKGEKGSFTGDLQNGKFTQNTMLSLVKQYGKVNLYKENFKGSVSADINKEKLLASFALTSNNSAIKTKAAKLNSKKKTIDATIEIVANKHPIGITLKGNTSSPSVSIDAQSIIQNEVKKAVGEKLNGLLKGFF